jgi:hypothetical protein
MFSGGAGFTNGYIIIKHACAGLRQIISHWIANNIT